MCREYHQFCSVVLKEVVVSVYSSISSKNKRKKMKKRKTSWHLKEKLLCFNVSFHVWGSGLLSTKAHIKILVFKKPQCFCLYFFIVALFLPEVLFTAFLVYLQYLNNMSTQILSIWEIVFWYIEFRIQLYLINFWFIVLPTEEI